MEADMQKVWARTTRSASFVAAISLAFPTTGLGQASPDSWPDKNLEHSTKHEWPDGPNKEFLKNLLRPDNHNFFYRNKDSLSCSAGDTVKTKFDVEREGEGKHPEDRWYARLNDDWVIVPHFSELPRPDTWEAWDGDGESYADRSCCGRGDV
jgi:hypothetical protein